MAQAKPRLYYLNARGKAEVARLILAEAGVQYEDHRISPTELPEEIKSFLFFGENSWPLYVEGDFRLTQAHAIVR